MLSKATMSLALLGSAEAFSGAFAPKTVGRAAAPAMSAFEDELGVIDPTGFWDPLELTKDIDQATFDRYRLCELKHGRIAQLAVIGYVVPEFYRFPGEIAPGIKFADVPNGVAALDTIPSLGWAQIFFLIGAVDYWGFLGNFPGGMKKFDDEELADKRALQELQHGRLAMLAVLELLRHDSQNYVQPGFDGLDNLITGLPFLY